MSSATALPPTTTTTLSVIPNQEHPLVQQSTPRESSRQWTTLTQIAPSILEGLEEALAEYEWDQLLNTPSPQQQALKRLLEEGHKEYLAGETEEIVGDTFA